MRASERARRERQASARGGGGTSPGARPRSESGWRGARGVDSASSSPTSRTFAANAAARSSPRSQPSSFRCEPQPEELTTTSSTSSNASMSAPGERLPLLEPAGVDGERAAAPCGGATTSNPSAASTRAVAAFTSGKTALWTQPVSRPTRPRRGPAAGVTAGPRPVRASAARSRRADGTGAAAARLARAARAGAPARMRPG